jgi:hypothetical protein
VVLVVLVTGRDVLGFRALARLRGGRRGLLLLGGFLAGSLVGLVERLLDLGELAVVELQALLEQRNRGVRVPRPQVGRGEVVERVVVGRLVARVP